MADIQNTYSKANSKTVEDCVLGSIINSRNIAIEVSGMLTSSMFWDPLNKSTFSIVKKLSEKEYDYSLIVEKITNDSKFGNYSENQIKSYIDGLLNNASVMRTRVIEYALILKEYEIKRKLLLLSEDLHLKILNKEDIFDIAEYCREKLINIYDFTTENVKNADKLIDELISDLKSKKEIIKTGFGALDDIIYSLEPETVTIIAARPSVGKTAMGLGIANNLVKQNLKVLFFSLEMSSKQLTRRLLSIETGIDINDLKKEDKVIQNKDNIKTGLDLIKNKSIFIDDNTVNLRDIINKCKQYKLRENIDVIIIDYIQLVVFADSKRSREQEVSHISSAIKRDLAKALKIPVITLCQLSRKVEEGKGKRPQLSMLRESGSLENDADNVILLHRPDYYDKDKMNNREQSTEVIVAKGRDTGTGICELTYKPYQAKFENVTISWSKISKPE